MAIRRGTWTLIRMRRGVPRDVPHLTDYHSIKMYKSRITKWKLDKKNKEHEVAVILRKMRQREAIGKASAFRVRKRLVNIDDVLRYFKRKASTQNSEFQAASPDVATPSDISCWTPIPTSTALSENAEAGLSSQDHFHFANIAERMEMYDKSQPNHLLYQHDDGFSLSTLFSPTIARPLSPPKVLLIPEQLIANIKEYFRRSFGNKTWILDRYGNLCSVREILLAWMIPPSLSYTVVWPNPLSNVNLLKAVRHYPKLETRPKYSDHGEPHRP
jgi:hypothetical protein